MPEEVSPMVYAVPAFQQFPVHLGFYFFPAPLV